MAIVLEKAISILVGNLNSSLSYLITTVLSFVAVSVGCDELNNILLHLMPRNHLNDLSVPFKKSEYHHLLLHVHGLHISKTFYESEVEFLFSYIGYFLNTLESGIEVAP